MHTLDEFLELKPTSYLPLVARMAGKGGTHAEIANALGLTLADFGEARTLVEGFDEALKLGERYADDRVESALYQSAVGYHIDTEKVFHHQGIVTRAPTREFIKPDTTAAKFWLVNRRPDDWADKQQVDVGDYGAMLAKAARDLGVDGDK